MFDMNRYGCPYRFAIDYLIRNGSKLDEKNNNYGRQVINIVIKVLEEKIKEEEKQMKNLTMKDVTINQSANQQYELLVNDKTIWVDGPEDIDEIAEVLEEMGIAFDKENADNINQAYFENEDAFDYYYLENKVGIETIKEKLEEEDEE